MIIKHLKLAIKASVLFLLSALSTEAINAQELLKAYIAEVLLKIKVIKQENGKRRLIPLTSNPNRMIAPLFIVLMGELISSTL